MPSTLFTNLGNPVDASWLNQVDTASFSWLSGVGGTANAVTATGPLTLTAYTAGQVFRFLPVLGSTAAVTLNINGLGAKDIILGSGSPLTTGDLAIGVVVEVVYDGTNFQMQSVPGVGYPLPIAKGGTGQITAPLARTALGAAASGVNTDIISFGTNYTTVRDSMGLGGLLTGRNRFRNGGCRINTRKTISTSSSGAYFADGWALINSGTNRITGSAVSTGGPAVNSGAYLNLAVTLAGAPTAAEIYGITHPIEGNWVYDFFLGTANAKGFWVTFDVFASVPGTYPASFRNSAQDRSYVAQYTVLAASTWETKSIFIPGDVAGTWLVGTNLGLRADFCCGVGTTFQTGSPNTWVAGNFTGFTGQTQLVATAAATFRIANLGLMPGNVAPPLEILPDNLMQLWCARYLPAYNGAGGALEDIGWGVTQGTSQALIGFNFDTPPRIPPTGVAVPSLADLSLTTIAANTVVTALSLAAAGLKIARLSVNGTGTPYVVNSPAILIAISVASQIIFTGAEL